MAMSARAREDRRRDAAHLGDEARAGAVGAAPAGRNVRGEVYGCGCALALRGGRAPRRGAGIVDGACGVIEDAVELQ